MTPPTPALALQPEPTPTAAQRLQLAKGRMTVKAVERIHADPAEAWRKTPKQGRDRAIETLHAGRQVATDFGFDDDAKACEAAIRVLEKLAELDSTNGVS